MLVRRGRRFNDPFDPDGSLSLLTLRSAQFTDRILHSLRRLRKITLFDVSEGGRRFNDPLDPYGSLGVLAVR